MWVSPYAVDAMRALDELPPARFQRTMQVRHLVMLSLGGVIGTGLFFNTGYIIGTSGAFGTVAAYLIGALVVYLVMLCLGELSVAMPETGAFHVYAARYLGPATGFAVAWLYWLTWTVALGSSLTAAAFCMQYWFPRSPVWGWCLLFGALIFGLNMFSSRWFAESEFWFALVKVLAILAFIVFGGAAVVGWLPYADGSPAPGWRYLLGPVPLTHASLSDRLFPNGALPILMTMVAVNFAFSGTELIGIAAGETEHPQRAIPIAIRTTMARLLIFFIGTVLVLAASLPMQQASVVQSPFVTVFEKIGLPYAAGVLNVVILTAILSAANSGLYASARMLWSLAEQRTLPRAFARLTRRGIPLVALCFSMLGGLLALLTGVVAADTVFVAISAISGFAVVAVWLSICASHYAFRRAYLRSGAPLAALHYRAPWFPLTPILGFALCLLACICLAFDPAQRIALWCGLPFVAACYAGYFLTQRWRPSHVENGTDHAP
ncbi:S-methylmethionine permease [Xanthomonas translucens pv. undulosa]|jgi:S-methylmethionine transporter|uniref:Amino acid transporter n=3 Tax=Xanthomonas campestris pv. translucens TaxID=343 RepID=A0A109HPW1_XANCT|nr:amino acid transporter [Xanthomonas translucens pv. undulosa]ELQ14348.1 S-methylmethionine transporter [Xanthomonas translucens DAR61454]KTF34820.1 amino acid transporter [Xanthomonas translucens pv. translucens]KWV14784.1 amino acid transporter [Xanthomonas translucens]SCB05449.1 S-methylmethionine permease [Xanthomonas translucens pv. translucens DSM 18974]